MDESKKTVWNRGIEDNCVRSVKDAERQKGFETPDSRFPTCRILYHNQLRKRLLLAVNRWSSGDGNVQNFTYKANLL